jgi:hypothetical protein
MGAAISSAPVAGSIFVITPDAGDARGMTESAVAMLPDGYPFHSPGRYILWFLFELSPGDCGLVSQADTHLLPFKLPARFRMRVVLTLGEGGRR